MEPGFFARTTVLLTTGRLFSPFLNKVILGSFIISLIAVSKYPQKISFGKAERTISVFYWCIAIHHDKKGTVVQDSVCNQEAGRDEC